MAKYEATDNATGRKITFDWNDPNPPTDADMEEVFKQAGSFKQPSVTSETKPNAGIEGMTPEQLNALPNFRPGGQATEIGTPAMPQWKQDVAMAAKEYLPQAGTAIGASLATPAAIATQGAGAALVPLGAGLGKAAGGAAINPLMSVLGFKVDSSLPKEAGKAVSNVASGATETAAGMVAPALASKGVGMLGSLLSPVQAAKDITRSVIGNKPEWLYGKTIGPSTTLSAADRSRVIKAGLEHEIPVTQEGYEKNVSLINQLGDRVQSIVDAATDAGGRVNVNDVLSKLSDLKGYYANSGNKEAIYNIIDSVGDRFTKNQFMNAPTMVNPIATRATDILPSKAQKIKQATYKDIGDYYGDRYTPEIEAQKAIATGLKEGVEGAIPGQAGRQVKDINKELGDLLELRGQLSRATGRIANRNPIGLPAEVALNMAAHGGAATPAGVAAAAANNPWVKTNVAFGLNRARKWAGPKPEEMQVLPNDPILKLLGL